MTPMRTPMRTPMHIPIPTLMRHSGLLQGDLAYLFLVSARDKQWSKSEAKLRKVVQTFRA